MGHLAGIVIQWVSESAPKRCTERLCRKRMKSPIGKMMWEMGGLMAPIGVKGIHRMSHENTDAKSDKRARNN